MIKNDHSGEIAALREKWRMGEATGDEIRRCRELMEQVEEDKKWQSFKGKVLAGLMTAVLGILVVWLIMASLMPQLFE